MSVQKKDLEEFKNEIIHEFKMWAESVRRDIKPIIDGIAADLASYREDTEGHGKGYKVSDS